ncbi:uncharacterized protein I206_100006 [Kwoniella pini CBS 10737]|uniref:Uncharacterized protein n=1 Tax=Kwoniella pini CBS 10737 TaxID=1296096 RepID=A0A1B9HSA8_9TREE|nr:uncharacterized protein I206_07821 [Kwoniella pini CBS 10737]OCF46151.1 hypothetical protein I206_07821 [Kwoniella pini CBS 10737]
MSGHQIQNNHLSSEGQNPIGSKTNNQTASNSSYTSHTNWLEGWNKLSTWDKGISIIAKSLSDQAMSLSRWFISFDRSPDRGAEPTLAPLETEQHSEGSSKSQMSDNSNDANSTPQEKEMVSGGYLCDNWGVRKLNKQGNFIKTQE